ncbi:hypothetical protein LCGC14_0319810 [marine sediment metagenome]|uniref:Uncharacterized protein n=1 Tax=marine sediment metagenome TaxID=412755 RepID=A0A0F9WRJ2_9ZZZZ
MNEITISFELWELLVFIAVINPIWTISSKLGADTYEWVKARRRRR